MTLRHLFQMSQVIAAAFLLSCAATTPTNVANRQYPIGTGPSDKLQLPAPFDTPSARNNSKVIGWPKGKMPTAAPGFEVSLFAENLDNPRQAYPLAERRHIGSGGHSRVAWPGRSTGEIEESDNFVQRYQ